MAHLIYHKKGEPFSKKKFISSIKAIKYALIFSIIVNILLTSIVVRAHYK